MQSIELLVKILIIVSLVGVISASRFPQANDWDSFKRFYDKNYEHSEEPKRREAFERSKAIVERFNKEEAQERGFKLGINEMSDWSEEELETRRNCSVREPNSLLTHPLIRSNFTLDQLLSGIIGELPPEVDWRLENRVGRVQNQAECGACWAFAATGLLEGQMREFEELSEAFLIEKKYGGSCKGGSVKKAILQTVNEASKEDSFGTQTEARVLSEDLFPYRGQQRGQKNFVDLGFSVGEINQKSFKKNELEEMLAKFGPVPVSMSPDETFTSYREGIYSCKKAASKANQKELAVLVTGFGTDSKYGDFWMVKNSWGLGWGEAGYARIARNEQNNCNFSSVTTLLPVKKLEPTRGA